VTPPPPPVATSSTVLVLSRLFFFFRSRALWHKNHIQLCRGRRPNCILSRLFHTVGAPTLRGRPPRVTTDLGLLADLTLAAAVCARCARGPASV